ncbi:hypothetical protein [Streptomyces sp. DSM 41033]
MGEIEMKGQHLDRLLADSTSTYGTSYQHAFEPCDIGRSPWAR